MPAKLILWFLLLPPFQPGEAPTPETVTLKSVIQKIGRITGKTMVIDPSLREQELTLVGPLPDDLAVLTELLYINHVELLSERVGETDLIKVYETRNMQQMEIGSPTPIYGSDQQLTDASMIATQIIPLKRADPNNVYASLRQIITRARGRIGDVMVVRGSRSIVIRDLVPNLNYYRQLIAQIDQDYQGGTRAIALSHLRAEQAVALLRSLYPPLRDKDGVTTPTLLAEPLGDHIVLNGSPDILREAADLLSELDRPVREPTPQPEPTPRYRARIAAIRWNGPPASDQGPWAWFEKLARDHADRVLCDISLPIAADARAGWGGGKTSLDLTLRRGETADLRLRGGELSFDGAIPLGQTTVLGDAAQGWIVAEIQPIK